jgi:hypothetical protein
MKYQGCFENNQQGLPTLMDDREQIFIAMNKGTSDSSGRSRQISL